MYYRLIQRCLLCQSSEADKFVKNHSQIANILDKRNLHGHYQTGQYSKINKRIHITEWSILKQTSFHIKCFRKLETSVNNLKRLIDKRKLQKSGSNNQAALREKNDCLVQHYPQTQNINASFVNEIKMRSYTL